MRSVPRPLLILMAAILQTLGQSDSVTLIAAPNITVNQVASFICVNHGGRTISDVEWRINGQLFPSTLSLSIVMEAFDNGAGVLTFTMPPLDYHMFSIVCEATYYEGSQSSIVSDPQVLLIQGLLSFPDGSLMLTEDNSGNITLSWTPPPRLDEVHNEPETMYCVNITNSTSSDILYYKCNITETGFSYPIPPLTWCYAYIFSVIPVNSVGHGAPASALYNDSQALIRPYLLSDAPMSTPHSTVTQTLNMSASVCRAEVTCVDVDTGDVIPGVLTIIGDVIEVTLHLVENRFYNATIMALNVAGPATSCITISTHEIQTAEITPRDNGLEMSTTYSEGSSGKGALYCFVHTINNQDPDFTKSFCIPVPMRTYTLPHDRLHRGYYSVFVYDVEGDGNLQNGVSYPAHSTSVTSDSGQGSRPPPPRHITQCTFTSTLKVITSDCEIPPNSEATGIQVLVQWHNISALHVLHTIKTTNRQTSANVEVDDFGTYQVTVFPIRGDRGIVDSNAEFITEEIEVEDSALINSKGFSQLFEGAAHRQGHFFEKNVDFLLVAMVTK